VDLSSEASRGDFNETIATHGEESLRPKFDSYAPWKPTDGVGGGVA